MPNALAGRVLISSITSPFVCEAYAPVPGAMTWWRGQIALWQPYSVPYPPQDDSSEIRTPGEHCPLPVALTVPEQCAVLLRRFTIIVPSRAGSGSEPAMQGRAAVAYQVLTVTVADFTAADAQGLMRCLREIRRIVAPRMKFGPDFRSATWGNREYTFTAKQGGMSFGAVDNCPHWLSADFVLANAGDEYPQGCRRSKSDATAAHLDRLDLAVRLRDVFKNSEAWDTLIEQHPDRNGLIRLAPRPIL